MSSNFDFLKEYDKTAFICTQNMERTLYSEPLSALGYGGRFIEYLRNALYQKHYKTMKEYNQNLTKDSDGNNITGNSFKREDLSKHISDLYHAKILKNNIYNRIMNAYNIRHNIHLNNDIEDTEADKQAAKELYKEIFEISKWYCKHIDDDFDENQIKYREPSKEKIKQKKLPSLNITKIFDNCVICGGENISSNRNICPKCKRKMRIATDLEDLLSILNNNSFNKDFLRKNSYDKYEIDYLIHSLREFKLISREANNEFTLKNLDIIYDFITTAKSYDNIEKILIAFYNGLIDAKTINYGEYSYYNLGREGNKNYMEFYDLIVDKKVKQYLNFEQKGFKNSMDLVYINMDEISYWYDKKVREKLKSKTKKEDISFNQMSKILMDKYLNYRQEEERKEDIIRKLRLNEKILNFWFDETNKTNNKYPFIKHFIFKNREIDMKLFTEALTKGLNKKEAINYADITQEFVDKYFNLNQEEVLKRNWRLLQQPKNEEYYNTYKNIYFYKKSKEFRTKLKDNTINSALKMSNLHIDDFNEWYNLGKKEFKKINTNLESELYEFYIKTTKVLMDNWLNERKKGNKRYKSCDNLGIYHETLKEWFQFKDSKPNDFDTNKKYKFFRDLYIEYDKINMDNIIKSIENGMNKTNAAKNAEINLEDLEKYYQSGKELKDKLIHDNGLDEKYLEFYNKYEEIYLPKRRESFLKEFEKVDDLEKAAKNSELTMDYINHAYNAGKNGEEEFIEFYEKLLELKMQVYTYLMVYKHPKEIILIKTGLTQEEIEENKDSIQEFMMIHKMILVIVEDKRLDKITKKYSILIIQNVMIFIKVLIKT